VVLGGNFWLNAQIGLGLVGLGLYAGLSCTRHAERLAKNANLRSGPMDSGLIGQLRPWETGAGRWIVLYRPVAIAS